MKNLGLLDQFHLDHGKMSEIARAVYENPSLLAEFERAPEATAGRINGFTVPAGFHLHLADADNRLYPAEEAGTFGAADRSEWARMEFRVGYKTVSLVACA
ncbi:MAG: hypothetical protein JOZ40_14435 [Methylobacteriaceae bacterium]|nr:hypothetical protein [Methylobacteriaceae bacterium]